MRRGVASPVLLVTELSTHPKTLPLTRKIAELEGSDLPFRPPVTLAELKRQNNKDPDKVLGRFYLAESHISSVGRFFHRGGSKYMYE